MIDFDILKKLGSHKDRIRAVFTAPAGSDLRVHRERFEKRIESRTHEGISSGLRHYKAYAAVDLAWDSQPITPELIPFMAYAQGKIDFKALKPQMKDIRPETLKKFTDFDEKTGEIKSVNVSKFLEVNVNLLRSYVTRRTATLAVKYTKLFPFLRYESISKSFVAKLRADVLSQRIEMMANQYGYRHDLVQAIREELLYGHCLEFVDGAWDCDKQLRKRRRAAGVDTSNDSDFEIETRVVREGVMFRRPHPTRTFWDNSAPLSAVNTDTGPSFMGFWTISRYGEVAKNTGFFNRAEIAYADRLAALFDGYKAYFELYFANASVNFPRHDAAGDIAGLNDREKNIGVYTTTQCDGSVALVEYFEKVIPKDCGLGDYPFPVWLRLVVANGRTVIFGEFLPDTPAVYFGYNEADSRQVSISFAHEILPFQDQMTNILNQLLFMQRASLIKVLCANLDIISPEILKEFRAILKGDRYTAGPLLLEFDGSQLQDTNLDIDDVFKLNEARMDADVNQMFVSLARLLELAERVLNISAQELGQSERREISATQTVEIANTTNTILSYMGLGVDEALAAKKRLLFNSLMALGEDRVYAPVVNSYLPETIKAAGFEAVDEDAEADTTENLVDVTPERPKAQTVLGTKQALNYDYHFTARDGAERMVNAKAAEVLVNLIAQLAQMGDFLQSLGKPKLYLLLNEVIRLSGAGVDVRFEVGEGESEEIPSGDAAQEGKAAIEAAISQILTAIEQDRQRLAQLEATVSGTPGAMLPPQTPPPTQLAS